MVSQVRTAILRFIEETGATQAQIAAESGLSVAVISQFINGTYAGDNEKTANTLNKYLRIAKERINIEERHHFYSELYNTRIVMGAAEYAHKHCQMVLIRGDSGAGKTTALKYYAKNNAGVIFITANSTIRSGRLILQEIADAMGKPAIGCNVKQTMDRLLKLLTGTKRLIIIDEADRLTLNALQTIRDLNDIAKVGIVLAGNNKLYTQMLIGIKGGEFDQIRTRLGLKSQVMNEYTLEEMQGIFPEADASIASVLLKKANSSSLREAITLYNFGVEIEKISKNKLTAKRLASLEKELE